MNSIYQTKGKTLEEQYFDVGTLFGESIRASAKVIARQRSKQSQIRKAVAEKSLINLRGKKQADEFLRCLQSWANGAQITIEQAMWLMADNLSGCQTMMVRYATGVSLMHTEEDFNDMSSHMTGEKVVSFDVGGELSRCIVYNDLLPGAGLYGWKRDLIVAVDTLFLREDGIEYVTNPVLANVIAWMIWRMSPEDASPENILTLNKDLGELIDGYAINIVRKVGGQVEGYKLTLARSESHLEHLGAKVGDYLRQVNIVDPSYSPMEWASKPRQIWRGGYKHFLERLQIMDGHVRLYAHLAQEHLSQDNIESCHFMIQKTIYTELNVAYINDNVGAVCIGLIDNIGTSVSCKINDQKPFEELEYIDLV